MKILLVEDDIDLNETIKEFLENFYEIEVSFSSDEALEKIYENKFDLIILDVKLPGINGFELAQEIRKDISTPIIFLTSLNSINDIEKGFLSGGDDYITKPFSLKELKLRIDAIFRRIYGGNIIEIDEFLFNLDTLELKKQNTPIHLKTKEAKLLKLFIQNKNKILSKEEILNYIYDFDEETNEQSLRVFINKLRKLFPNRIKTIKGIGYKFVW